MYKYTKNNLLILLSILIASFFISCKKKFDKDDYTAYFRGEVLNPIDNFVLLCKDNNILDTIYLDENNNFFKKYDSLTPGMYIYKHNPEFQYIYFEKNDSLYMRFNSYNFNNSIIFSGRGSEKNNFLMDLYLKNEDDKQRMNPVYDDNVTDFIRKTDSSHAELTEFYLRKKNEIKWSEDFDLYAKTLLDLQFYLRKEIYPFAHITRNNKDITSQLPEDYYDFRKNVDLNNEKLSYYSPFPRYLAAMINSIVNENRYRDKLDFNKQIEKLNTVDSLIQNQKVKNTALNNLAFIYLLDDQNINLNNLFLKRYFELSTDRSQQNEILQIQKSIIKLQKQKKLPNIELVNTDDKIVSIDKIINKPTIIFIWSKYSLFHFEASRKRAIEILDKNPEFSIIAINIDNGKEDWAKIVAEYSHPKIIDLHVLNFNEIKDKWIINKINRTLLINADGSINNAFVNLFDNKISEKLKKTR